MVTIVVSLHKTKRLTSDWLVYNTKAFRGTWGKLVVCLSLFVSHPVEHEPLPVRPSFCSG